MNPDTKKKLIGAVIAAALAVAVYYGLLDQKQADSIRNQADQTLGTGPAGQQQQPTTQPTAPQGPTTTQNAAPPPPPPQDQAPAPPPQH